MNTIGSHPGAILFRLGIMIILIAILVSVFFSYMEDAEREIERSSILQTKRIIDSSLAIVFANYAVKGRLSDLNRLDGGNPFVILEEYQLLPANYRGELDSELENDQTPGWYYLRQRKHAVYKSRFAGADRYYAIVLHYQDVDQSGRFEAEHDKFGSLQFVHTDKP